MRLFLVYYAHPAMLHKLSRGGVTTQIVSGVPQRLQWSPLSHEKCHQGLEYVVCHQNHEFTVYFYVLWFL